jgi:hypothetical protein
MLASSVINRVQKICKVHRINLSRAELEAPIAGTSWLDWDASPHSKLEAVICRKYWRELPVELYRKWAFDTAGARVYGRPFPTLQETLDGAFASVTE